MFASAELFRRQGYTGTGLKQVVAEADAPFGSLYHFFPGGKEQLGDEVIRMSGQFFLELFETIADAAPDFVTGVGELLRRCRADAGRHRLRRRLPDRDGRARGREHERDAASCHGRRLRELDRRRDRAG